MKSNRGLSPIVERPTNVLPSDKQTARSTSSSAIPTYELDPATQRLLEENECLLFEVNTLRGELQSAQESAKTLKEAIAAKEEEVEKMRQKLGDANIMVVDASGRYVTYETECKRLADEKAKLLEDLENVRSGLDAETESIRKGMDSYACDSARRSAVAQVQQFQAEIFHFTSMVEHFIATLKKSAVGGADQEQILENVQKEKHALMRLSDSIGRINTTEKERVVSLVERAKSKDLTITPTELVVVIRSIVSRAFEAGITATEQKLSVIESLCSKSSKNTKEAAVMNGNAEKNGNGTVRHSGRRQRN